MNQTEANEWQLRYMMVMIMLRYVIFLKPQRRPRLYAVLVVDSEWKFNGHVRKFKLFVYISLKF